MRIALASVLLALAALALFGGASAGRFDRINLRTQQGRSIRGLISDESPPFFSPTSMLVPESTALCSALTDAEKVGNWWCLSNTGQTTAANPMIFTQSGTPVFSLFPVCTNGTDCTSIERFSNNRSPSNFFNAPQDAGALGASGDFLVCTIAAVSGASTPGPGLVQKDAYGSLRSFRLQTVGSSTMTTNYFQAAIWNSAGTQSFVSAPAGSLIPDARHFVCFSYDYQTNNTSVGQIYVDGVAAGSAATTLVGPMRDTEARWQVGGVDGGTEDVVQEGAFFTELDIASHPATVARLTALVLPQPQVVGATWTYSRSSNNRHCSKADHLGTTHPGDRPCFARDGYLAENASTQLLASTQEFNDAYWTKSGLNVAAPVVTANTAVAPNGLKTADTIEFAACVNANDASYVTRSTTENTPNTFSVYMKKATAGTGVLSVWAYGGSSPYRKATQCTISDSEWTRCSVTVEAATGTTTSVAVGCSMNSLITGYAPAAAIQAYVWGAQQEAGLAPTSYIKQVPSGGDLIRNPDQGYFTYTSPFVPASLGATMAQLFPSVANGRLLHVNADGGIADRLELFLRGTQPTLLTSLSSSVEQVTTIDTAILPGSYSAAGWRVAGATQTAAVNSEETTVAAGLGTLADMNRIYLGYYPNDAGFAANGYVTDMCVSKVGEARCANAGTPPDIVDPYLTFAPADGGPDGGGFPVEVAELCDVLTANDKVGSWWCMQGDGGMATGSQISFSAVNTQATTITQCPSGGSCKQVPAVLAPDGGSYWTTGGVVNTGTGPLTACWVGSTRYHGTSAGVYAAYGVNFGGTAANHSWSLDTGGQPIAPRMQISNGVTNDSATCGTGSTVGAVLFLCGRFWPDAGTIAVTRDGVVCSSEGTALTSRGTPPVPVIIHGHSAQINSQPLLYRAMFFTEKALSDARIAEISAAIIAENPVANLWDGGTVPITFGRTTLKFCDSGDGTGNNVPIGKACIVQGGILMESSRVNYALRSQELNDAVWTNVGTPTVTADNTLAPDSTLTAETIADNDNTAFEGRAQSITSTVGQPSVFSCYVQGVGLNTKVRLLNDGTACTFDTLSTTNFTRLSCADASASASPVSISVSVGTVAADTGSVNVWGCQMERNATFATSYIVTNNLNATRGADSAFFTASLNPRSVAGTLRTSLSSYSYNARVCRVDDLGSDENRLEVFVSSSSKPSVFVAVGGSSSQTDSTPAPTLPGIFRSAAWFTPSNTQAVILDGGFETSAATTLPNFSYPLNRIYIGTYPPSGGFEANGIVSDVCVGQTSTGCR